MPFQQITEKLSGPFNRHVMIPSPFKYSLLLLALPLLLQAEPPPWSSKPDREIAIKTRPGMMRYDLEELRVEPGQRIQLNFENPDDLAHNWVLLNRDEEDPDGVKFSELAFGLGALGMEKAWIPDDPRVLAKSGLVGVKEKEVIYFEAPTATGSYPFLCTVPGHALLMRGKLLVEVPTTPFSELSWTSYQGDFKKLPDFSKLKPFASGDAELVDIEPIIAQEDQTAVVWEGQFELEKGGNWEFALGSDDGARLSIDGELVINHDGIHGFSVKKAKEKLEPGLHSLRLTYFDGGGQQGLSLIASLKDQPDLVFSADVRAQKAKTEAPPEPILLSPENPGEAIVHRTFFSATEPRSIAVGYPGNVNLSWNADTMNLNLIWRGGFINVARHWNGRGASSEVAGFDRVTVADDLALQKLESPDQPWISHSKKTIPYERDKPIAEMEKMITIGVPHPGYHFVGYRVDARRFPTFRYRFHDLEVSDTFEPKMIEGIEAIERVISFSGEAEEGTHLLLGSRGTYRELEPDWLGLGSGMLVQIHGGEPIIREAAVYDVAKQAVGNETRRELLLPITGPGEVTVTYRWKNAVGGREE
ncbi:MAG: PA14 domain-containing protein [Verrucomicrobiota bacterium]